MYDISSYQPMPISLCILYLSHNRALLRKKYVTVSISLFYPALLNNIFYIFNDYSLRGIGFYKLSLYNLKLLFLSQYFSDSAVITL